MSKEIWVYVDQFKGQALPASWEAVYAARGLAADLGGSVVALVFGQGVESLAQTAIHYGADEVLLADD
ncbi:MAG: electron transfer flavoprotein subunit alpha, partial [Anaerolineae bacterium]